MKYLWALFLFTVLLLGCKKNEVNPDSHISFRKYARVKPFTNDTVFRFYIPSAFTPNGDGINEYWFPVYSGLDSSAYHISILDKSGKVIFESSVPPAKYDGVGKDGELLPEQALSYYIEAKDIFFGDTYTFKGQFVIIK